MNQRRVLFSETSICDSYCDPTNCSSICYITCPSVCSINLPPDGTTTPVDHKSHKFEPLIISLSIIGLFCFIFCIYSVYKLYKNTTRPVREQQAVDHDEEHGPLFNRHIGSFRTIGLQPSTINLITAIEYKTGEGLVEGTDCSICLSEFQDDESLRLLPKCNHAFHLPCIDTWLRSHTNCPMCRAPIVANPNGSLSPIPEQSLQVSPVVEDSQAVVVPEVRERENVDLEHRTTDQPMRRSVSMDSLAASRLSNDITNARLGESSERDVTMDSKSVDFKRFMSSSCSFKISLQKEPVLMKRSFSCSGKVLFSKHNYHTKTVLPL